MRSMTGFGAGTAQNDATTITVQIASVNNRGLQVHVRSDLRDLSLDELVKQEVRSRLVRGSVTVQVQVRHQASLAIDRERVVAAWNQLAVLAHELKANMPSIDRVLSMAGSSDTPAKSDHEPLLRTALQEALQKIMVERQREGQALKDAFDKQLAALRELMPAMRTAADARSEQHREALRQRVAELLSDKTLNDDQLIREVALYADRIDVTEELVRLATHLDAFAALLSGTDDQLGRKLDFLLQEIGREINTTGAKSNDTTLTNLVLQAKAIVEQCKEQAANIC